MELVLIFHFLSCLLMTGVIWIIQVVHYPSFHFIDKTEFKKFESFHSSKISFVVTPLMLVEMATALAALFFFSNALMATNLVLLFLTWLATFAMSIPAHQKLLEGYDQHVTNYLISTNWFRTLLWSVRTLLLVVQIFIYQF